MLDKIADAFFYLHHLQDLLLQTSMAAREKRKARSAGRGVGVRSQFPSPFVRSFVRRSLEKPATFIYPCPVGNRRDESLSVGKYVRSIPHGDKQKGSTRMVTTPRYVPRASFGVRVRRAQWSVPLRRRARRRSELRPRRQAGRQQAALAQRQPAKGLPRRRAGVKAARGRRQ